MKNYKVSKKLLSLLLTVLMVFSTVSLSVSGAGSVAVGSDCANGQHTYGGTLENVNVTCETDGYQKNICSVCKVEYEVVIKAKGHQFDEENGWVIVQAPEHEPTSIKDGTRKNKCLNCDYEKIETVYSTHVFDDSSISKELEKTTCITKGKISIQCNLCLKGVVHTAKDVDPDAHNFDDTVYIVNSGFTCKKDGLGVKVCNDCGALEYVTLKADPDAFHATLEWKVATALPTGASCSNGMAGTLIKECPYCDDFKTQIEVFYAEHKLVGNTTGVAATCTEIGYEIGYCEVCKNSEAKNILFADKNKHVWLNDVVFSKDGCDITYLKRCANNIAHTDTVEVKDVHTYDSEWKVVDATCMNVKYKENTCTTCGDKIIVEIGKEYADHDFDESTVHVIEYSTCSEEGLENVWCRACKKTITRPRAKHLSETAFIISETPATCKTKGVIEYKCKGCSVSTYITTSIDKDAHNPGSKIYVLEEPTCCEAGVLANKCSRCGEFVEIESTDGSELLPATVNKHVVSAEWNDEFGPTCTEDGYEYRVCTETDKDGNPCNFVEKKVLLAGHNFTSWSYGEATCEEVVVGTRHCIKCNKEETQNFTGSHKPGKYVFTSADANCSTGGTVLLSCSKCHKNYDVLHIEAGEHAIDLNAGIDIKVKYPDDNTYCGGKVYTCLVDGCGAEVLKPIEHEFYITSAYEAPTCLKDGKEAGYACKACAYSVEAAVIKAPGKHSYTWVDANGTVMCTACGIFEGEGGAGCEHFCHNKLLGMKILVKLATFFWKLFGKNHFCECGAVHYHEESVEIISRTFDDDGNLIEIEYKCSECKGLSNKTKTYTF